MSRKHLLTISLLLPLVAASAAAQAGTTISDTRYWPHGPRASAQAVAPNDAFNFAILPSRIVPRAEPATSVIGGSPLGRYQGGPKPR
jgi:2-keto-3-deoxy-L-rhamnonate aldolase RhmA